MGTKITKIGVTNDKISARGGLPLILRYIGNIGLYGLVANSLLSFLPKFGHKGLQLPQFLKQVFAYFIDGTDMSISGFDSRKADEGYAALLENKLGEMASSHQIKRFFAKLSPVTNFFFNKVLHALFVWRLKLDKPRIIVLGIDTMVLDNDGAKKREECKPTYKRKKGFQPLHICWGPFLVDVLFRKGNAHSNHGTDYPDRVRAIVRLIRRHYSAHAPIIICADRGFADQKAYEIFEENLHIHYITTGRSYPDLRDYVQRVDARSYGEIAKGSMLWKFLEFGNCLKTWTKFRRCIYTHLAREEDGQYVMGFAKPDNMIYTNIGNSPVADGRLRAAGGESYFGTAEIIRLSHQRGADELIHRSLKELATKEQLPFKSFGMNRAYYFLLVITHFIFEAYKQDVTYDVVPVCSYPNTFRRKMVDFAVKITARSRQRVLNVTKTIFETTNIVELWKRCKSPPTIMAA